MSTSAQQAGTMFSPELVTEMFNAVSGHSALAKLAPEVAIPFQGREEMVFTADGEAQLVAEGGAKAAGDATVTPVIIRPVKFVYQKRVSDEFLKGSDATRLSTLRSFSEGFAKKIARGLDIAAIHGLEPSTKQAASFQSTNSFDGLVTNVETYNAAKIDENLDDAANLIDGTVTGVALSKLAASALGQLKGNGAYLYPEFRFGQNPDAFAGMGSDVNTTVNVHAAAALTEDEALIGDFSAFRWGYVAQIPLDVIRYGDPDGAGRDLKRYNEVCLRAEAYIGWGILNKNAFALVKGDPTGATGATGATA